MRRQKSSAALSILVFYVSKVMWPNHFPEKVCEYNSKKA